MTPQDKRRDMPSSKEASLVATLRNYRSRPLKTKYCHFLALPPELRAMIYVYTLSDELPRKVPGTYMRALSRRKDSTEKTKASAKSKRTVRSDFVRGEIWTLACEFPLLLTNKLIRDEVTPMIYKHHTFCLEMPTRMGVFWSRRSRDQENDTKDGSVFRPLDIQGPHGRLVTRLEVGNLTGGFMSPFWESSWGKTSSGEVNSPDLPALTASFPNLRLLRLHIRPDGGWDTHHANWTQFAAVNQELWVQLLARLDHLEFVIWHFGDEGISFREAIAPGPRLVWKRKVVVVPVVGHWIYLSTGRLKTSLWSLQRSTMPKHCADQAGEVLEALV